MQKVGSLSGGERCRAALARLAAIDANFLVLDEPTNHLDLWARDCPGTGPQASSTARVLFVSHDRYFVNHVADHLLVVEPGRFRVIEGNYDTYLHLVKQGLAKDARAAVAEKSPASSNPAATTPKTAARRTPAPQTQIPLPQSRRHRSRNRRAGSPDRRTAPALCRSGGSPRRYKVQEPKGRTHRSRSGAADTL